MFKRIRKWWVGKKVDDLRSDVIKNPGIEIEAYYDGARLVVVVVKYLHTSRVSDFKVIASVGAMREQYKIKVQQIEAYPEYVECMIAPISEGRGEFIPGTDIITMDHLQRIIKELNSQSQVLFTEHHI